MLIEYNLSNQSEEPSPWMKEIKKKIQQFGFWLNVCFLLFLIGYCFWQKINERDIFLLISMISASVFAALSVKHKNKIVSGFGIIINAGLLLFLLNLTYFTMTHMKQPISNYIPLFFIILFLGFNVYLTLQTIPIRKTKKLIEIDEIVVDDKFVDKIRSDSIVKICIYANYFGMILTVLNFLYGYLGELSKSKGWGDFLQYSLLVLVVHFIIPQYALYNPERFDLKCFSILAIGISIVITLGISAVVIGFGLIFVSKMVAFLYLNLISIILLNITGIIRLFLLCKKFEKEVESEFTQIVFHNQS